MPELTHERLRELLEYNPDTGVFTWRVGRRGTAWKGSVAGTVNDGYVRIGVDGEIYRAHLLVWLWKKGVFPSSEIDHRDGNTTNNRFLNLREATKSENQQNGKLRNNNTSGYTGVSWQATKQLWVAYITVNTKRITLGRSRSFETALALRVAGKIKHHPFQPTPRES